MSEEAYLESLPLVRATGVYSQFTIRGVTIGGGQPVVIAGPCAIESAEQILEIAAFVKANGALGLRGGAFKPRSSPYSFQGLGQEALEYLAQAREATGLLIVAEVTSPEQIAATAAVVDLLQIGARNMQNFELLMAAGRSGKPVLLKRGLSATIQELLQAAEYILKEGNSRVILCERGIRTFETATRNTLDINAIPLLKQLTHLPIFVDPSHGTGRSALVTPVAKAALAAGADGLIIEVHPQPEQALSDGMQSLTFPEFQNLMRQLPLHQAPPQPVQLPATALPGREDYLKLAAQGEYDYLPVYTEFMTDAETPVTAFAKLTSGGNRFLLESVERGEQVGRYSFIGWEPLLSLTATGDQVTIVQAGETATTVSGEPLLILEQELKRLKVALTPELGKFYGGAVGFVGYDYVRQIEDLPERNPALIGLPDLHWLVPKYLACFDHIQHKITLIVLSKLDPADPEQSYQTAVTELTAIVANLGRELRLPMLDGFGKVTPVGNHSSLTKTEFEQRVQRIKEYIVAGDAFQVVLSQRIEQPFNGDPLSFYRILRTINPSPYLFYLDFGGYQLTGSSPEVMVRLEDEQVTLKPIAGTRPRGGSTAEDQRLQQELLQDEKERAEHVMLVDLGRNDLGRVCRFGSVKVSELMAVENYSHVMHIVSTIQGELLPEHRPANLLRAVFPAGTLSGAPKVRAMEIIEELEPVRREFYGGAVGYLGFNGNLDTCITIRSVLFKEGKAYLQVGAGIVADSVPENEYQETMNKAGAMLAALARTGGVV